MEAEDKTINKGDMVMVVRARPCCGYAKRMGLTFVVDEIASYSPDEGSLICSLCKKPVTTDFAFMNYHAVEPNKKIVGFQIGQLIKLKPPPVDESVKETKKLTEKL